MNTNELLDQFVLEARDCLESIGKGLLEVERRPDDATLLNDLFRSVHTLKGNCGLFEFRPLEQVVHAAEDLLDRVRHRTLGYSGTLADVLLDAMDFSARLIDQIEHGGRFDADAEREAGAHVAALAALLEAGTVEGPGTPAGGVPTHPSGPPADAGDAPPWLARMSGELAIRTDAVVVVRYTPDEGCFFKGEDPWRLATTVPGLVAIDVTGRETWPRASEAADWDCYRCNLDIVLVTGASLTEVTDHFRCVPDEITVHARPAVAGETPATPVTEAAPSLVTRRATELWAIQRGLLSGEAVAAGTVTSARTVFRRLLPWIVGIDADAAATVLDALPVEAAASELLAWAHAHGPAGDGDGDGDAIRPGPAEAAEGRRTGPVDADVGGEGVRRGDDTTHGGTKVLKVGQEKVDRLMDLIGEMVVAKNSLPYLAHRAEAVFGQRELAREIKAQYTVINRIAEDMQHAIMQVRMLPVGAVFQRFGRLVRDLSRKLGKEVRLVIEGEDTEADKNVIEPLADPLIHILRNSLDHGIELPQARLAAGKPAAGTIRIVARQESDRVIIEIGDDGAGVDAARVRAKAVERGLVPADRAAALSDHEAVQLVFLPGFSTADRISDLSGRGVGMDVVRTAVERIHGTVELTSVHGRGTTIRLSLPLSMAVTNVMVIESAGCRFGVPMDLIVETVRVHEDDIHRFKQARTTVLRGRVVPLRGLNELLALEQEPVVNAEGEVAVLVVRVGNDPVGLLVDHFHGAIDIILKPLEGVLASLPGFAGTALMGDGGVLMILNPKELLS